MGKDITDVENKIDVSGVETALYKQYSNIGFKEIDVDFENQEVTISDRIYKSITQKDREKNIKKSYISPTFFLKVFQVFSFIAVIGLAFYSYTLIQEINTLENESSFDKSVLEISSDIDTNTDDFEYINEIDAELAKLLQ